MTEPRNENIYSQPNDPGTYLKSKQMDIESGWLGKIFGTGDNSNINITGLIAIMLLLPVVIYTFFNLQTGNVSQVLEFWKIIAPLIGNILGYLFGKNQ